MKKILLFAAAIMTMGLNAQYAVSLNLHHNFDGAAFNYGDQYVDDFGHTIEITRVQYYLSSLKVNHDAGQETLLNSVYVLASGNITNYPLTTMNIQNVEGISFNLGVDQSRNHLDPSTYPSSHPLSLQTPSMHWGWASGYNFLVIEGMADSDNDGTVDKPFQFHAVGNDDYLTNVGLIETTGTMVDMNISVDVEVNIADWLTGMDLSTAGLNHGVFPLVEEMMANTNILKVFDAGTTGINDIEGLENSTFFDYSLPYAPTIYYKFPQAQSLSLSIIDMTGRVVLSEDDLSKEGNFFINKELEYGTYIAKFIMDNNEVLAKKFIVRR